jgi:hypothetical protein
MKAWSQNLGHEQMLTTFTSYGRIEEHRQGEIIMNLASVGTDQETLPELLHRALLAARR